MIFAERKTEKGFEYDTHNVVGKLHIVSEIRLSADLLDQIVMQLLQSNLRSKTVEGSIEYKEKKITYVLERESLWQENDEHDTDESWNDTPTSTKRQDAEYTPAHQSTTKASNWLQKLVAQLRAAYRKILGYPPNKSD